VWDHASDGLIEDAGGSSEVEGTAAGWVVSSDLAEVGVVLDCEGYVSVCRIEVIVVCVRLARKNSPEILRASHRTTTTFWPLRRCLATVLASRPKR
jgi:hypothetical protein